MCGYLETALGAWIDLASLLGHVHTFLRATPVSARARRWFRFLSVVGRMIFCRGLAIARTGQPLRRRRATSPPRPSRATAPGVGTKFTPCSVIVPDQVPEVPEKP